MNWWMIGAAVVVASLGYAAFVGAPYVPSQRRYVAKAFKALRPLSKKDTLVDIGSGDGRVLRYASQQGARAVGYEIHPLLVWIARLLSRRDANVTVHLANAWRATFPDTVTIVYAFAVSRDEKKLERLVQREANRLERPIQLLCYSSPLTGKKPTAHDGAFFLYTFTPL